MGFISQIKSFLIIVIVSKKLHAKRVHEINRNKEIGLEGS